MGKRLGSKPIPTIVVTHDRINMERLGHFHCRRHGNNCECTCDKHPLCCAHKGYVLQNAMLFANRLTEVDSVQACCNLCTNHPACRAWEYDSKKVCILKSGKPSFVAYPGPMRPELWQNQKLLRQTHGQGCAVDQQKVRVQTCSVIQKHQLVKCHAKSALVTSV